MPDPARTPPMPLSALESLDLSWVEGRSRTGHAKWTGTGEHAGQVRYQTNRPGREARRGAPPPPMPRKPASKSKGGFLQWIKDRVGRLTGRGEALTQPEATAKSADATVAPPRPKPRPAPRAPEPATAPKSLPGHSPDAYRKSMAGSDAPEAVKRLISGAGGSLAKARAAYRRLTDLEAERDASTAKGTAISDAHHTALADAAHEVESHQRAAFDEHLSALGAVLPEPASKVRRQILDADDGGLDPKHHDAFRSLAGLLTHVPHADGLHVVGRVAVSGRASANVSDVRGKPVCAVSIAPGDHPAIVAHELGHTLEFHSPKVLELCRSFLAHRCGDEPFAKLAEKFPGMGYRDDEYGRADDFAKAFGPKAAHYVGKRYENGTEVLSMGLEQMLRDPAGFHRKDPEYAAFVVHLLSMPKAE